MDSLTSIEDTPFQCVERVKAIELIDPQPVNDWMEVRIHLTIKGMGDWVRNIRLYVPPFPFVERELVSALSVTRNQ